MKECPHCRLVNIDTAGRCDCGYDFGSAHLDRSNGAVRDSTNRGWHKFLMKHSVGSPGHVVKAMARSYRRWAASGRYVDERAIIRRILLERVAAQAAVGGPAQYRFLRSNPSALDKAVDEHPDLFSIVSLAVCVEHPELIGPGAPADAFDVLSETIQEALDAEAPGWRTAGVWGNPGIVCFLCHAQISHPNPAVMFAAVNENGETEFACERCAPPLQIRAVSALGFFMEQGGATKFDSHPKEIRPECPFCHLARDVVPIRYGLLPLGNKQLLEQVRRDVEARKYVLGGCWVEAERWYCHKCRKAF